VTELSDTARQVLQSLQEKPSLNTPTLIAMNVSGVEKPEIEAALDELIAAGEVVHNATGWKLAG
jgi:hypothetical protein